jgi:hypothetical protein
MALIGDTSNLDTLMYAGEIVEPLAGSYTVTLPNGVVSSNIAGGMSKMQLQFINAPYYVNCTYRTFDYFEASMLEGFFLQHRGQKFIAYLIIEQSTPQPYIVQVMNDVEDAKNSAGGDISITYEVYPAIDRCFQKVVVEWGKCVGNPSRVWCDVNEGVKSLP